MQPFYAPPPPCQRVDGEKKTLVIVVVVEINADPRAKQARKEEHNKSLNFFLFESSWKKMKNDATFVRMRSGDHLGDAKMSKKGTSLRRI